MKNGKRHGTGTCFFPSGALYRGDWRNDQCHGTGTLLSAGGEILDCRFERGAVTGSGDSSTVGRIKILFENGCYYEGHYQKHKRHGNGFCIYPNGDKYEGNWHAGRRTGRARMSFMGLDGKVKGKFQGDFHADEIDGSCDGVYEDITSNIFKVLEYKTKNVLCSGSFERGRLQSSVNVSLNNGDKFIGNYKDGRPSGLGQMEFNHTIPDDPKSRNPIFYSARFIGTFKAGRRDGRGTMYWNDGSNFTGLWRNDMRQHGRMIMSNGCVYDGDFADDQLNSQSARIYLPSMIIYEGQVTKGQTSSTGMLLYPDGSIYYGMLKEFARHGFGKLIHLNGSYYEGEWCDDVRQGKLGKEYDATNNCYYVGQFYENKKNDWGREYSVASNQIYEGAFSFDKKNGDGLLYLSNG